MKLCRTAVARFFVAVAIPFVATFTFFVVSERRPLLTEPKAYIETLKGAGSATYVISLPMWKHFLAQDPTCAEAKTVIIGSSRVREIDHTVVGTSVCNLYGNGLGPFGFASLARALPTIEPGSDHRAVYIGLDHFWLWSDSTENRFEDFELMLLARSATLWRTWAVLKTLDFFQWRDAAEAVRRYRQGSVRFEDQDGVWYSDGHLYHPRYYAQKHAGLHPPFSQATVDDAVNELFNGGKIQESNLRAFETGVRLLHAKGYAVRAFWNPVSPAHIESARQHFPDLFERAVDTVDRLATALPFESYYPARQTLDASRFGCSEADYFDTTHMDVDCLRRVFAVLTATRRPPTKNGD